MTSISEIKEISIEQIIRNPNQPRLVFNSEALQELADSIKKQGLIQPIIVRALKPQLYEIVAGERRWRASQRAGLQTVPCIVRNYDDKQVASVAISENVFRVDLSPIEEALAYERYIQEFGSTHEEIADILGKSRTTVTNKLRLLQLHKKIQEYISTGELTEAHAKILITLSANDQLIMGQRAVKGNWSVKKLGAEVKTHTQNKSPNANLAKDPDITHVERKLSEMMGAKVTIEHRKDKGNVIISYCGLDTLQGILEKFGYKEEETW